MTTFDDWFDSTGLERGFEDCIYEAAKQAFKAGYLDGHNDGYGSNSTVIED